MSNIDLYVYDLSKGMARQFSALFLGKHFDGVWHTGNNMTTLNHSSFIE